MCPHCNGFMPRWPPPRHAEALVSRLPLFPAFFSQSLGLSRGNPWLLSMRNRRMYVMRLRDNWRTSGCVAPSSPCIPPLSACRVSVHLHALYVRPASSSRASSRDHCWHSLCLRLPFAVIWLGPDLQRGSQTSTLDWVLSFGTLAQRTGKQPGHARRTTTRRSIFATRGRVAQWRTLTLCMDD